MVLPVTEPARIGKVAYGMHITVVVDISNTVACKDKACNPGICFRREFKTIDFDFLWFPIQAAFLLLVPVRV